MTNQSIAGKRSFRTILSTVLALVLIVTIFASTALASTFSQYDVNIIDNGERFVATTTETEPIKILNQFGITLASKDKLDLSNFESGKGGTISISRLSDINIKFGGVIKKYSVYATTVGDALDEIGITYHKGDTLNKELGDKIKSGMVLTYDTKYYVNLSVDGKKTKVPYCDGKVKDLLAFAGVKLGSADYTKPSKSTKLTKGQSVTVYRVSYKTIKTEEVIKYKTKQIKDSKLEAGTKKVIKKGVKGKANVTYKLKYVDGKKTAKTKIDSVVTKRPVTQEEKIGTKNAVKGNGVKSAMGISLNQKITGKYTHYCACATCNGNSRGITASGKKIYNGMSNPYYIACNWVPLGTVLNVDGKNYTVTDRGGSGLSPVGRIDIFTPEGHAACYKYGTGYCTIKVVRLGW